ncbi:MAG: GDYXXLXY domain-containing protein [Candidatus Peregrinibacteria bacterium]
MNTLPKWLWYGIIPALWAIVFAFAIFPNEQQISVPSEYPHIILKNVQPVDPRDLLRGDFVALQYEFTRPWIGEFIPTDPELFNIATGEVPRGTPELKKRQEILTALSSQIQEKSAKTPVYLLFSVNDKKEATLTGFSFEKPSTGVFIAGEVRGNNPGNKEIRVGIERFFVPAGKGWEIERIEREGNLSAEIALDSQTGKAIIVDLWQEKEKIDTTTINAENRGW